MLKILDSNSIKSLDDFTIKHEPIASIDLMERAALSFVRLLRELYKLDELQLIIFCGPGNNGGDGLAIARLLNSKMKAIQVFIPNNVEHCSNDFIVNLNRIQNHDQIQIQSFKQYKEKVLKDSGKSIVIDALFGTGLSRKIEGDYHTIVEFINKLVYPVISVDIPSGMSSDKLMVGPCVHAIHTISFHVPKLAFYLPENIDLIGKVHICPIGLDEEYYKTLTGKYYILEPSDVRQTIKVRRKNVHKSIVGKAFLVAGKTGMMGAAILAAKACMRSGTGLLTVHLPKSGLHSMQNALPEAVCEPDEHQDYISHIPMQKECHACGIGPGLGINDATVAAFKDFIQQFPKEKPMVIDADGLNILSANREILDLLIGHEFVLTPHIGEFQRLFGASENSVARLEKLSSSAKRLGGVILLKGPNSALALPDGRILFNTTGNPGMATAGSGDVLTGLLLGFLSQGYSVVTSAVLAVYIHGFAGDLAAMQHSEHGMIASDIIEMIPQTFLWLEKII